MWAVFLSGGLFGVILHRLWLMLLTSFGGVLLSWHAALILADTAGKLNAAGWAADHAAALNGGVLAVTVTGILVQALTAPRPKADAEADKKKKKKKDDDEKDADDSTPGTVWLKLPGLKAA
jgi:hypothetical protein